jgi:hypothetical protein
MLNWPHGPCFVEDVLLPCSGFPLCPPSLSDPIHSHSLCFTLSPLCSSILYHCELFDCKQQQVTWADSRPGKSTQDKRVAWRTALEQARIRQLWERQELLGFLAWTRLLESVFAGFWSLCSWLLPIHILGRDVSSIVWVLFLGICGRIPDKKALYSQALNSGFQARCPTK